MANTGKIKAKHRRRKALSVRGRVRQFGNRPRLSVFRSLKNIYGQIIDDASGRTLAAASSIDKALRDELKGMKKADVAAKVGTELAGRAKQAGIVRVAFDRGHCRFHGRVKALADAARAAGLEF